jgi:dTDP-4-amino-4,6-dideoxygalactose transaminase
MIPLLRPKMPDLLTVMTYMQRPYHEGKVSNFGELWWEVYERLLKLTKRHVLPVTSGTTAIQVALSTMLKPNSNVVVPDYTHIGTLNAVIGARMNPVLTSVLRNTWVLDPQTVTNVKAKAMVVVAPFGYAVDTYTYDGVGLDNNLQVIYDFAGGWGSLPDTPNPVCYSLHATKNFAIGEGGLISFARKEEWERARRITNFNICPDGSIKNGIGGNYKIDELRCAMILAQLDHDPLKHDLSKQKKILMGRYWKELEGHTLRPPISGVPSLCVLPGMPPLEEKAAIKGIQMKRYFPLISQMPFARFFQSLDQSDTEYFNRCMAVPSDVTEEEFQKVCSFIRENV